MPQRRKMNKSIAGYHMLMILSAVDFSFNIEEEKIIREWIFQEFPFRVDLDNEIDTMASLTPSEWMSHFHQCMDDYYEDATPQERNDLLKFVIYLSKADGTISASENEYIKHLFSHWDVSSE